MDEHMALSRSCGDSETSSRCSHAPRHVRRSDTGTPVSLGSLQKIHAFARNHPGCEESYPLFPPDADKTSLPRELPSPEQRNAEAPDSWCSQKIAFAGTLTLLLVCLVGVTLHESPIATTPHEAVGRKAAGRRSLLQRVSAPFASFLNNVTAKGSIQVDAQAPSPESELRPTSDSESAEPQNLWDSAPRLSMLCRLYGFAGDELWETFLDTFFLFWPWHLWSKSDLVLVWDDEGTFDHRMASVLASVPPYPQMRFEKLPPDGTLCSDWRGLGYSRTQYSNFYCDLYTDAEFVAIVDSDTAVITPVTPDVLFAHENGTWKPRLTGSNMCCFLSTGLLESIPEVIGHPAVADFMPASLSFPLIIRRDHFPLAREHVRQRMNASTFEEAFFKICTGRAWKYSQFDIIAHYLWYYKHNDYVWHIKTEMDKVLVSNASEVLAVNIPKVIPMKHNYKGWTAAVGLIHDYLCVASGWQAGDCSSFRRDDVDSYVKLQLLKDFQGLHAAWGERGLPAVAMAVRWAYSEHPWESPEHPSSETVKTHLDSINRWHGALKQWHSWGNESQISCLDYDEHESNMQRL